MADFLTLENLVDECERGLKQYGGAKSDLIKNMINMVYLTEILAVDTVYPLHWLLDFDDTLASKAPANISAITLADPGVITTDAAHGFVANDVVSIYSIVGTTQLNNRMFKVATAPSTTTLTLIDIDGVDAISSSAYTAWSSGGVINHRGLTLATTGKDVERIIRCSWHGEDDMELVTDDDLEEDTQWWDDSTTRPEKYYHRKSYTAAGVEVNHLLWFACADQAYDLRYWFIKRPAKLTDDAHVPLLPPKFHYAIVAGVMTRLGKDPVQTESTGVWPQLYMAQLEALKQFNRKWYKEHEHFLHP